MRVQYYINYPTHKQVINKMLCSKICSKASLCPLKLHVFGVIISGSSENPI